MFKLDLQSRLPIYEQLYQNVVRMSALGVLQPGERLPAVRALAGELGINPNTVQKAYQMLERDGIICSMSGKGSYLTENAAAVEQKKEKVRQSLFRVLQNAMEIGFTEPEVFEQVRTFFSERSVMR